MSQTKAQLISDLVQALNFTGTASAPANGAFLSAANTLALATNSAQRLTIDSSGDVGIGTTSPTFSSFGSNTGGIEISDVGSSANALLVQSSSNEFFFANTSSANYIAGTANAPIIFSANATERMRITSTGSVGIGTSSPSTKLQVSGGHINIDSGYSYQWGDSHERIEQSDGKIEFFTGNSEKMTLSGSNLGIGTTSPSSELHVKGSGEILRLETTETTGSNYINFNDADENKAYIGLGSGADDSLAIWLVKNSNLRFATNNTERMRIDGNGRLLLGTSTARAVGGESNPVLHIEGAGNTSNSWVNITRFQSTTAGPNLQFAKARSNTPGTYTLVQSGDTLGTISFLGADGTDMANYAATISAQVDGTAGSNDMPGRLVFSTTADGAGTVTERMRITKYGEVLIGKTTTSLSSDGLRLQGEGAINLSRTSTSTVLGTANGASIALVNPSATDNNFSNIGGYNSNSLVTSQINFINTNISNRHGAIAFMVHDGSTLAEKMRITKDARVGIGTGTTALNEKLNIHTASSLKAQMQFTNTTTGTASGDGLVLGITGGEEAILWNQENTNMLFATNNTERLRIDSSGRLLYGLSSSTRETSLILQGNSNSYTTNPGVLELRVGQVPTAQSSLGSLVFGCTGDKIGGTINAIADNADWSSGSSHPTALRFFTTSASSTTQVERMRINSAGNVGIGASTISDDADHCKLVISGQSGTAAGVLIFQDTSNNEDGMVFADDGSLVLAADRANATSGSTMQFRVDGSSEKMRILSNGKLLINRTNEDGSGQINLALNSSGHGISTRTGSNSTQTHLDFGNQNGIVGSIQTNGSGTSFNTSSDYRLKENAVAISDGITRLKTLKPYRFNFKADASTTLDGFFAHEVTAVPEAISGTKDAVDKDNNPIHQGIDQSKLVPLLTAALQEAITKIETLETEVAALKAA